MKSRTPCARDVREIIGRVYLYVGTLWDGHTYIKSVFIDTSSLMSFPIKRFIPCCSKETPNGFLAVAEAASV